MDLAQLQKILQLNRQKSYYQMLLDQNMRLMEELNQQLIKNRSFGSSHTYLPYQNNGYLQHEKDPSEYTNDKKEEKSEKPTVSSYTQEIKIIQKGPKQRNDSNEHYSRPRNDTKNIPKNFGSAICTYIRKNDEKVRKLIHKKGISLPIFYRFNKRMKEQIQSIHDLRNVWSPSDDDAEQEYKKCFRILSYEFIRKHSLNYVFESRIKNVSSHIKYRPKLLEALKKPSELTNLKDF